MQNKTTRSVSPFNNELKLKGFNVFQIESDGSATTAGTGLQTCTIIRTSPDVRNKKIVSSLS